MTAAGQFNLLDQARNLSDIARALLEVADVVDLTDLDESILRRIGTGAGVMVASDRQWTCRSDLGVKLHQLGNGRLAAPRAQRHQDLNKITADFGRILRQLDDLARRRTRAAKDHRDSAADHFGGDFEYFLALVARQHGVLRRL